ncbi:hypothetical protein [Ochrobactrum soli]|nr:hypothetical protein [[Ochrobactrum] soli]
MTKPRPMKYQVNHAMRSGGPKFSSLTEALAYIRHCMNQDHNSAMTISKI